MDYRIRAGASAEAMKPYEIDNSCRFNVGDSAYLKIVNGTPTNEKIWTWSAWVKRGTFPDYIGMMTAAKSGETRSGFIQLNQGAKNNAIRFYCFDNSDTQYELVTDAIFRDPSSWYHFVCSCDATDVTAADRMQVWVNGERQSVVVGSNGLLPVDTLMGINGPGFTQTLGAYDAISEQSTYMDGYFAEVHFIDGTRRDASSFGELNAATNQWVPIEYTGGSYGTNGYFLEFKNSAALGTDTSGNGNNFTVVNLAATDQMIDSPQNSTGGNFCTFNPLNGKSGLVAVLAEGNLRLGSGSSESGYNLFSTFAVSSGKWYYEYRDTSPVTRNSGVGWCDVNMDIAGGGSGQLDVVGAVWYNNIMYQLGSSAAIGATLDVNVIAGVAIDIDAGKVWFSHNGTWWDSQDPAAGSNPKFTAGTNPTTWMPILHNGNEGEGTVNYGQDSSFAGAVTAQGNTDGNNNGDFYYAPPTGFLALCTDNLSAPGIALPTDYFNTVLYTDGAGAKTGVGFQPDLVWLKARSVGGVGDRYKLTDNVRGVTKGISSNSVTSSPWATVAETTDSTGLTAFGADGFTVGADAYYSSTTGTGMVAWNWLGANTTVSNTSGTITSTVSANTAAGFSICGYTGTGSNATFGHGLSVAPEYVMVKNRATTDDWAVYNTGLTSATYWLEMNDEVAEASGSTIWNSTAPTATLVNIGSSNNTNKSGDDHIAYCFHSVEGYSKITTYIGNGNADGPFIYCGFRPAWVLVKEVNGSGDWLVNDSARDGFNPNNRDLGIWRYDASGSGGQFDQLSNGLKVRTTAGNTNADGQRMVVLVFAEYPFKFSNAR